MSTRPGPSRLTAQPPTETIGSTAARAFASIRERDGWGPSKSFVSAQMPSDRDSLAVRTGWLRRRLIIVPIEQVGEIVPRQERIMLRG